MFLWTAFTIGLFGSLHCVGMCGPIAIAAGGKPMGRQQPTVGRLLLYNFGKTLTYALLGGLVGLLGKGIFLAGFQKNLSIVAGVALLAIAFFSINVETNLLKIPALHTLVFKLKSRLGHLLQQHRRVAAFAVGTLNGLLPCGLVYMAIVGALSTGGIFSGMSYMALFGLGTMPLLLLTALAGNWAGWKTRLFFRKATPVFLVLFGLLFISRGLNFHLPGDFFFLEKMSDVPMCH